MPRKRNNKGQFIEYTASQQVSVNQNKDKGLKGDDVYDIDHGIDHFDTSTTIELSIEDRNREIIIAYMVDKTSAEDLAKQYGLSRPSISKIIAKFRNNPGYQEDLKRAWRKGEDVHLMGDLKKIREELNHKKPAGSMTAYGKGREIIDNTGDHSEKTINIKQIRNTLVVLEQRRAQVIEELLGATGKMSDFVDLDDKGDDDDRE